MTVVDNSVILLMEILKEKNVEFCIQREVCLLDKLNLDLNEEKGNTFGPVKINIVKMSNIVSILIYRLKEVLKNVAFM